MVYAFEITEYYLDIKEIQFSIEQDYFYIVLLLGNVFSITHSYRQCRVVKGINFKSFAPHLCGLESC
jgi:hypothetical protein